MSASVRETHIYRRICRISFTPCLICLHIVRIYTYTWLFIPHEAEVRKVPKSIIGINPYYVKTNTGRLFIIVPIATHRGRVSLTGSINSYSGVTPTVLVYTVGQMDHSESGIATGPMITARAVLVKQALKGVDFCLRRNYHRYRYRLIISSQYRASITSVCEYTEAVSLQTVAQPYRSSRPGENGQIWKTVASKGLFKSYLPQNRRQPRTQSEYMCGG